MIKYTDCISLANIKITTPLFVSLWGPKYVDGHLRILYLDYEWLKLGNKMFSSLESGCFICVVDGQVSGNRPAVHNWEVTPWMPRAKYNPGLRGASSPATSVSWSRAGRTLSTSQSLAQERMVKPGWQGQLAPLGIYWKLDRDRTSCQPHRCDAVVLGQGDQADDMARSHTLPPSPQEWHPCIWSQRWQPWGPPQVGTI